MEWLAVKGAHGDNFSHAFLWSASANPIDLNPAGFTNSYLYAAGAAHQVGYAANNRTGLGHAYLWSGTAASGIDLTPVGYSLAVAYAASATHQVGSISGPLPITLTTMRFSGRALRHRLSISIQQGSSLPKRLISTQRIKLARARVPSQEMRNMCSCGRMAVPWSIYILPSSRVPKPKELAAVVKPVLAPIALVAIRKCCFGREPQLVQPSLLPAVLSARLLTPRRPIL